MADYFWKNTDADNDGNNGNNYNTAEDGSGASALPGAGDRIFYSNTASNTPCTFSGGMSCSALFTKAADTGGTDDYTNTIDFNDQTMSFSGNIKPKSGTLNMGNGTTTVSGNVDFTGVTLNEENSTLKMDGSSKTIDSTVDENFYNIEITGSVTLNNNIAITNNLNVSGTYTGLAAGTITTLTGTLTLTGTCAGPGYLRLVDQNMTVTTGTITMSFQMYETIGGGATRTISARTFANDLIFKNTADTAVTWQMGAGTFTITDDFYFGADGAGNATVDASVNNPTVNITDLLDNNGTGGGNDIINAGSGTWTIGGNVNFVGGVFNYNTSTIKMTGTGKTITNASQNFHNLEIAAGAIISGFGGTDPQITNQLTVDGQLTSTDHIYILDGDTVSIGAAGNLTAAAGRYLRLVSGASISTTTGTLDMDVRHATTGTAVTVRSRTYAKDLIIYSDSNAGATATPTAGTLTCVDFTIQTNGNSGGIFIFDGSANNPTVTISGTVTIDEIAGRDEPIRIDAGSGTWTISGSDLDLTDVTTFNHNNGEFILSSSSNQTLTNNSKSFYNLTSSNSSSSPGLTIADNLSVANLFKCITANSVITFTNGITCTLNDINLDGQDTGTRVVLRPSASAEYNWNVTADPQTAVSNVDVSYCNASSGSTIDASDGTNNDGGNNTNWNFGGIIIPLHIIQPQGAL